MKDPKAPKTEAPSDVTSRRALRRFIKKDIEKINGTFTRSGYLKCRLFEPGTRYTVRLRTTRYYYLKGKSAFIPFLLSRMILRHLSYKFGYEVSYKMPIGPGLSISHVGYVTVYAESIGSDCSLRPGVVIGKDLSEDEAFPTVGNNVEFGVGCKVIGKVTVGDGAVIGANAVVTHDVPPNTVVGGVPARVIRTVSREN